MTAPADPRLAAAGDVLLDTAMTLDIVRELLVAATSLEDRDECDSAVAGARAMVEQAGQVADAAAHALGRGRVQSDAHWNASVLAREGLAVLVGREL